jgi:hypothetical protein
MNSRRSCRNSIGCHQTTSCSISRTNQGSARLQRRAANSASAIHRFMLVVVAPQGGVWVVLPALLNISLIGVPAHICELETTEHLLDEWCWLSELHPDTINRQDYSSFRLRAWCVHPELILTAMDLIVVEPPVQAEEAKQLKWALSYPIEIAVLPAFPTAPGRPPPPPPSEKDPHDSGGQSRRCR